MSIVLESLTKRYDGHPVVNQLSLEVADGEFFVLLGPSGSGKSTVLRMIAGLVPVDDGRIWLHGRDVTQAWPQQRGVGFVFQYYALFRHMSVAENIEFALRVRKVPAPRRRQRREVLLELVGLAGLGERMPDQLSGGQQQRVALARALAHQPEVLLLDEPFGALDARIRIELRRALRAIQIELGVTTLFVTHDQEEAFELADRLGVMHFGRLLEVGPPTELYQHPQTEFVATFLGSANLLVGQATPEGVRLGALQFPLGTQVGPLGSSSRVQVLFRPEDVALAPSPEGLGCPQLGQGEIEQRVFVGPLERLQLRLPPIAGVRPISPPAAFGDQSVLVEVTRQQDRARHLPLRPGDRVWVGVRRIHALSHPGLSFIILIDGSALSQAALDLGGLIARPAHARVTVLGCGPTGEAMQLHLQTAKERLASGLAVLTLRATADPPGLALSKETERQPCDLVIAGLPPSGAATLAEQILGSGEHHLLLVPTPGPAVAPRHALICVTESEPGKEDVFFGGRLVRHVGARATLLSVTPSDDGPAGTHERTERFLAGGVRTLQVLGVPAETAVHAGPVREAILNQMQAAGHDLLVVGSPLPGRDGEVTLRGLVQDILESRPGFPILIVRSCAAVAPGVQPWEP